MKKIFIILALTILLTGFAYAADSTVDINGIEFKIPSKYTGGDLTGGEYKLNNIFSIRCIDDNVSNAIGLWAVEKDFSEDINIGNHPVRHFCQHNRYVNGNHSHAYFTSGKSVYEISWVGDEITPEIEKLIEETPKSEIDDNAFYSALDKSVESYKEIRIDKLNRDGEYNYLEAKYQSNQQKTPDDARFKEILLTYSYGR